ncbi:hypothetical protein PUN28_015611 [Cardiocondyla obscurior]|uniref:Uncharacterized protein n=1 Tax=Cardiocondyla obscurior TaxID=286306 RepID=A0AAW2F023_9HYME
MKVSFYRIIFTFTYKLIIVQHISTIVCNIKLLFGLITLRNILRCRRIRSILHKGRTFARSFVEHHFGHFVRYGFVLWNFASDTVKFSCRFPFNELEFPGTQLNFLLVSLFNLGDCSALFFISFAISCRDLILSSEIAASFCAVKDSFVRFAAS